jgi:hypothetical protein
MKTYISAIGLAISVVLTTWSMAAETPETSTIITGTVDEFEPSRSVVLHSTTSTAPVRYTVSRETRFVDEAGAPLTVERITRGTPITVYYVRDADQTVASRVIVHREAKMTKARAKALKEYYDKLEESSSGAEKAQYKALEKYYDKLEDELKD